MLAYKVLNWDSEFFEIPIAKLVTDKIENKIIDYLIKSFSDGIELVYLLSEIPINSNFWDNYNFDITDVGGKVLYQKKISTPEAFDDKIEFYNEVEVCNELYDLSLQSGIYSRFKLDAKLSENAFTKLYKAWIENSVNKTIADEVLVYKELGKIVGMITLSIKDSWGDIGLIAVDFESRGKKIGLKLLNAANTYFYNKHIKIIGVETQINNIDACRFYQGNKFIVSKKEYIYHCRIK